MTAVREHDYALDITAGTSVEPSEPNDDITKYRIRVIQRLVEAPDEPELEIGHFDVWRFNVGAYINRRGRGKLFDLFDSDSDEAEALYSWLYDDDDELQAEVADAPISVDILHFSDIAFDEQHKSSNVVVAAAERVVQVLGGGCAIATLWPWDMRPPEFANLTPVKLEGYWKHVDTLEAFWGKMKFKRLANKPVFSRDLSLQAPSVEELLG